MADTDTAGAVREAFRRQAAACEALGSPFTARLCRIAADRLDATGGPIERRLLSWPGDARASGDSVPLRLAGALHAVVMAGTDEALAAVWPPDPESIDDGHFWDTVRGAFDRFETRIAAALDSPPQTNEVRRSSALVAGYLAIAAATDLPLRISEIGASAGLNLMADRYRHDLGGVIAGDPGSPVRLSPDWRGAPPPDRPLDIQERLGCDLRPFDLTDPEQRLRLLSYIWADQTDRLALHSAALDCLPTQENVIAQRDAIHFLRDRVSIPHPGTVHVIAHTIVWQYLPVDDRARGSKILAKTGGQASAEAPLAWLRLEDDTQKPGAGLLLTIWPKGETHLIARADFHGRWIDWRGRPAD